MSDIKDLTDIILKFRKERDWQQFHKPKDCAISLALEAAEVLEHFQWKDEKEIENYLKNYKEHIGDELADVLWWVLLMSYDLNIDLKDAFVKKMKKNEVKYPVEKCKGKNVKYTKL